MYLHTPRTQKRDRKKSSRYTAKLKAEYPCWCGSKNCRGTLLAPKRGRRK